MLRFPDCNQYLRKNLSKVPHQSLPKATEIWKKALWPGFQKTPILQERTFQQMCSKRPPNKTCPPLTFGLTFQPFFGPGWPVSPRHPKTLFAIPFCCKNHQNHTLVYYLLRFCCIVFVCIHVHAHHQRMYSCAFVFTFCRLRLPYQLLSAAKLTHDVQNWVVRRCHAAGVFDM